MIRPIGYYVHHQGAGHRHRAWLIARALLPRPCTLIGTFSARHVAEAPGPILNLPDDRLARDFDGKDGEAEQPVSLHYAPLRHAGIRDRMAAIAAFAKGDNPALIVVDVSVEVALFARLLSVPTFVWRLAGDRSDAPHLEAFRSAERLLAPFPAVFDAPQMPDWIRQKTLYTGFVGAPGTNRPKAAEDGRIVVVCGRGGASYTLAQLADAARAVPNRSWHVLGVGRADKPDGIPANLVLHGWVDDVAGYLAPASIVVGSGGDGVVATVAAAGKRFICLPEFRPYGEQTGKAEILARLGAAIVRPAWPHASDWPALIRDSLALDPQTLSALATPDAVARVTAAIDTFARESDLWEA